MEVQFILLLLLCNVYLVLGNNCKICKEIISNFNDAFDKTRNDIFDGGMYYGKVGKNNSYYTSETRLIIILEELFNSYSSNDYIQMTSTVEPWIEFWWKDYFKLGLADIMDLESFICVDKGQFCCSYGFFGEKCEPCLPCPLDRGSCSGNGTKSGTGACVCRGGYASPDCNVCNLTTHYEKGISKDTKLPICLPCSQSCDGCTGPGSGSCFGCLPNYKPKWDEDMDKFECVDLDECQTGQHNCGLRTYCHNVIGGFECIACSRECRTCKGPNNDDCLSCQPGYNVSADGRCHDVNECVSEIGVCPGKHEKCRNTPGSYVCDCVEGFKMIGRRCIAVSSWPKPEPKLSQEDGVTLPTVSSQVPKSHTPHIIEL